MAEDSANPKLAAEARRREVEKSLLAGATYREMRDEFGVCLATIGKDVRIIREHWAKELVPEERKKWILRDLRKLSRLEAALEEDLESDKSDCRLYAVDRLLKILKRRATLLGLDAPTKTAFTDPEGEHEYLEEAIKEGLYRKLSRLADDSGGVPEATEGDPEKVPG